MQTKGARNQAQLIENQLLTYPRSVKYRAAREKQFLISTGFDMDRSKKWRHTMFRPSPAANSEALIILGGVSYGGMVALEMARQLKAMGKNVVWLGIFDTHVSQDNRHNEQMEDCEFILGYLHLRIPGLIGPELNGSSRDERLRELWDHLIREKVIPTNVALAGMRIMIERGRERLRNLATYVPSSLLK